MRKRYWLGISVVAALLGFGQATMQGAKQKNAAAEEDSPLQRVWQDPNFASEFMGYGPVIEPKLTPDEREFYKTLDERQLLVDQPEKAIEEFKKKITPSSSALLDYSLATLYFREGELEQATRHYQAAVAKHPKFLRAQKNLGFVLTRGGEYAEAIPHLAKAIQLGGADGTTYGLLGFCHLNEGHHISAEVAYKNALLLDPENLDWRLGLTKSMIAAGDYRQAGELLDEMIQEQPGKATLWILQANVFIAQDQAAKAVVNLEAARQLGELAPPELLLLGDLYLSQEAKELALPLYIEAVEKDDGKHLSRVLKAADVLTSRGAWTEAQALFAKIRDSHGAQLGEEEQLRLLKLESRVAMAEGRGEDAIKVLEEIIQKNRLDGEALLLAGDYYLAHEQPEMAEMRYEAAARLDEYQADAWVKQAQLLVQVKKYAEAIDLLQRAQKSKPRDHIRRYLEKVETAAGRS